VYTRDVQFVARESTIFPLKIYFNAFLLIKKRRIFYKKLYEVIIEYADFSLLSLF
jgi:hypothetical protein